MPDYKSVPIDELALSQLNVALKLYFNEEEYPSVITLAGASEEIFGRLAEAKDQTSSLERKVTESVNIHKEITEKVLEISSSDTEKKLRTQFVNLENKIKNSLKHHNKETDQPELTLAYEREAAKLTTRALENYYLYYNAAHPKAKAFEKKKNSIHRRKSSTYGFTWISPKDL